MINIYINFFVFFLGAMVGSFLNVLILRIPTGQNFVSERSECPSCKKRIFWYENIPVFSFIFLRAKCSGCKNPINFQYPIVELITGAFLLYLIPKNINLENITGTLLYFSIFCAFLVHFVIDVRHKILPDGINIYLAVIFFIISVTKYHYTHWLLGAAIGLLFPLGVTYLFYKIRNQAGLGGGDIKLFAALGLLLGPVGIVYNIMFSCILGSLVGLPLIIFKVMKKDTAMAFGPFILIVAFVQIFFPSFFDEIIKILF